MNAASPDTIVRILPGDQSGLESQVISLFSSTMKLESFHTAIDRFVRKQIEGGALAPLPDHAGGLWAAVDASGKVVGCVSVSAPMSSIDCGENAAAGSAGEATADLQHLCVAESVRRLGVGTSLTMTVIEFARSRGFHTLRLETLGEMPAAQRLYTRLGFTKIRSRELGKQGTRDSPRRLIINAPRSRNPSSCAPRRTTLHERRSCPSGDAISTILSTPHCTVSGKQPRATP